ncbi:protein TIC 62, chloroplastic isoform X2 [Eucalyptus grandis]|uniref:protein TIC 62, chloroplastic isoform X2 n=1 Tax=Eucalyptus grandis TaxID=71139 RepID=UPI00192EA310|nr:protein TIC 62, chloroplastic isoform X2 [Eucalyptus grandis]
MPPFFLFSPENARGFASITLCAGAWKGRWVVQHNVVCGGVVLVEEDVVFDGATRMSFATTEAIPSDVDKKDEGLVFVAGATGKVGSRTVRELLKLGYRVRAGVRSAKRAVTLVQSVKQMKFEGDDTKEGFKPVEKLEVVECDLEKPDQIRPALANASVVICCIGASEKEVFDVTGPYRIDYMATKNLIDAATLAKVNHFIMVSSLGTNKIGFPAAILNLFWGVLIWKRKAEEALIASGIPYTIVRPGGMERPTDAYKETHNVTLSEEDTLFGGQVSNLQVAELMAVMAKNSGLSYCKVVEVIAETTAPLTPMEELLAKIPSQRQGPQEPGASDDTSPAPSNVLTSVSPNTPVVEEISQSKAVATRPLSPYPVYNDLKPPTSPTPTPPGIQKANPDTITWKDASDSPTSAEESSSSVNEIEVKPTPEKAKLLSPYAAYEELKPPSSPSPTPSGPKISEDLKPPISPTSTPPSGQQENPDTVSKIGPSDSPTSGPDSLSSIDEIKMKVPAEKATPLSPYVIFNELKPPSSPSPKPSGPKTVLPVISKTDEVLIPVAGGNNVAIESSTSVESYQSPYYVYEDLKPPTSPSPSVPVIQPASSVSVDVSGNGAPEPQP